MTFSPLTRGRSAPSVCSALPTKGMATGMLNYARDQGHDIRARTRIRTSEGEACGPRCRWHPGPQAAFKIIDGHHNLGAGRSTSDVNYVLITDYSDPRQVGLQRPASRA